MSGLVPDVGEARMARLILNTSTAGPENLVLRLYENDVTPASSHTLADYTEATYSFYSAVTLTSGNWTITPGAPTTAAYATSSGVAFWCVPYTETTGDWYVYGYYLTGSQTSTLYGAERFLDAPRRLGSTGDALFIRPVLILSTT